MHLYLWTCYLWSTCGVIVSQFDAHCFSVVFCLQHGCCICCTTCASGLFNLSMEKMIEQIVSPVLFLLVTTCDTISTISLCVRVFLNETKVALFFWSKLSRNQLRLPLVLPSLQVSDKPQDDDGAGFLELGKFIYSKTTPLKNRKETISDLFWAMTNCSK